MQIFHLNLFLKIDLSHRVKEKKGERRSHTIQFQFIFKRNAIQYLQVSFRSSFFLSRAWTCAVSYIFEILYDNLILYFEDAETAIRFMQKKCVRASVYKTWNEETSFQFRTDTHTCTHLCTNKRQSHKIWITKIHIVFFLVSFHLYTWIKSKFEQFSKNNDLIIETRSYWK